MSFATINTTVFKFFFFNSVLNFVLETDMTMLVEEQDLKDVCNEFENTRH